MSYNSAQTSAATAATAQSVEPWVQPETWVRTRLVDMLLSDPSRYIPDISAELDAQMALVEEICDERDEPHADVAYGAVWAITLAQREGIRLDSVFEARVRALVGMMLAATPSERTLRDERLTATARPPQQTATNKNKARK